MQQAMTKEEKQSMQQLRRSIGANLLSLRRARGYAQEEYAAKLGITPWRLAQYEHAKRLPDFPMLIRMTHLLNVGLRELL